MILMIMNIKNMPKNDPSTEKKIARIVPFKVPKAEEKILRLNATIIVRGIEGKMASKNGRKIPKGELTNHAQKLVFLWFPVIQLESS